MRAGYNMCNVFFYHDLNNNDKYRAGRVRQRERGA